MSDTHDDPCREQPTAMKTLCVDVPEYVHTHTKRMAIKSNLSLKSYVAEVLANATILGEGHDYLTAANEESE